MMMMPPQSYEEAFKRLARLREKINEEYTSTGILDSKQHGILGTDVEEAVKVRDAAIQKAHADYQIAVSKAEEKARRTEADIRTKALKETGGMDEKALVAPYMDGIKQLLGIAVPSLAERWVVADSPIPGFTFSIDGDSADFKQVEADVNKLKTSGIEITHAWNRNVDMKEGFAVSPMQKNFIENLLKAAATQTFMTQREGKAPSNSQADNLAMQKIYDDLEVILNNGQKINRVSGRSGG